MAAYPTAAPYKLLVPKGIWGAVEGRSGIQLFPVGYRLRNRPVALKAARPERGGVLRM